MSFKIYMNIDRLPRTGRQTMRIYQVKPFYELPRQIPLRDGLDLERSAIKLGVGAEELAALGISEMGIDTLKLRKELIHNLHGIKLRDGEMPMVSSLFSAVVGRLGAEKQALQPFDLIRELRKENCGWDARPELLSTYLRSIPFMVERADATIKLTKEFYPFSEIYQKILMVGTAFTLHPRDPISLAEFIFALTDKIYPTNLDATLDLVNFATCNIPFDSDLSRQLYIQRMENRISAVIPSDRTAKRVQFYPAPKQAELDPSFSKIEHYTAANARMLSASPLNQGEIVADMAKDYYEDDPALQQRLIRNVARLLYPRDLVMMNEMTAVALGKLGIPLDPKQAN
jgi:hypothetical protein